MGRVAGRFENALAEGEELGNINRLGENALRDAMAYFGFDSTNRAALVRSTPGPHPPTAPSPISTLLRGSSTVASRDTFQHMGSHSPPSSRSRLPATRTSEGTSPDNDEEDARAKAWTLRNAPIRVKLYELVPLETIVAGQGTEPAGDPAYSVKLTAAAKAQLDDLSEQQATLIAEALRTLASVAPRAHENVREINRYPTIYRFIAGRDARAMLSVDDEDRVVEVLKVGLLDGFYD